MQAQLVQRGGRRTVGAGRRLPDRGRRAVGVHLETQARAGGVAIRHRRRDFEAPFARAVEVDAGAVHATLERCLQVAALDGGHGRLRVALQGIEVDMAGDVRGRQLPIALVEHVVEESAGTDADERRLHDGQEGGLCAAAHGPVGVLEGGSVAGSAEWHVRCGRDRRLLGGGGRPTPGYRRTRCPRRRPRPRRARSWPRPPTATNPAHESGQYRPCAVHAAGRGGPVRHDRRHPLVTTATA